MSALVSEAPPSLPPAPPLLAAPEMNAEGEGATPLMYACQQGRDKDLKAIMSKKPAAVRERDRTLKSALHYCAENSTVQCAETVLTAAPELLDARDEDGYTTLHLAVIAGNCPLIRLLLARGADVNCLDNERHSVVHWATVCGEVEALETVLEAGAMSSCPDMHGGYPLHYAAQMCGPAGEIGSSRLGLSVLHALLSHGVEVNVTDQDGRQPILWAASAGSADAILALVNAGANVEADDKDGLTALHCAASRGHTDCLETLVSLCGAAVDVMDSNGCTALFYAVTLGHADATQLLLEHGAQPNRQDRKGRTPSHCGAAKGQLETLRILSVRGANMWARNVKGDYPLHEAVSSGRKDLVRWLLSQRPDAVNASNNDGRCPLHIAAINNNVEMCKIVLDHESLVNPVMRTSKGGLMTPLDAALYKGNRGCAKYLQLHGGVPATKLTSQSAALRGTLQRAEPHSDAVTTPDWGGTLTVPELRGAQSLVQSPIELAGHKHLTVVDATRTLEVRVEDELLHRRGSESSTDDKVRRRRRKRRPKRDCSEAETDSSDRHRRRRRRRRKDHDDSSEEDSEVESRRRRRKGRKDKGSEESESEDTSKRKKKESRNRRKRSVSGEHQKEDTKKEKSEDINLDDRKKETISSDDDDDDDDGDLVEGNSNDQPKENRRVLKEEIKTKEVTKSKKVIEHKEKEKSYSKPTITKTSKTTHEETKTEEQTTTKTSEIISTPPDNKGDEISTQDSQEVSTQQVVTAIVHQEESAEQTSQNIEGANVEDPEQEEKTVENPDEEKESVEEPITDKPEEISGEINVDKDQNTEDKDQPNEEVENKEDIKEVTVEESNLNGDQNVVSAEKMHEDGDFWEEEEIQPPTTVITSNSAEILDSDEKRDENTEKEDQPTEENGKEEGENNIELTSDQQQENEESVDKNEELENTVHISEKVNDEPIQEPENVPNNEDKPDISDRDSEEVNDEVKGNAKGEEDPIINEDLENQEDHESGDELENEENIEDISYSNHEEENRKGLIKILGRSEVRDENLKGIVKVEKISSEVLKEKSKVRERERGRRRTSSFEIVSPARSLLEDDLDSETPRSRSRTGADSSQLQDSGFEPSPRRDSKKESSRIPRACRRSSSHNRLEADSDDDRPSLSTVSVTQAVQHSMRKYHLERRIFHELLELKRLQIRAGRANEAVLVKRLVDDYRRAGLCIGLRPYEGVFTFRGFEKYLYDQLRLLQSSDRRIIPRLKSTDDLEKLTKALRRTRAGNTLLDNVPENPIFCTHGTHRCYHATHAYTGIPCAAYIAKINHHSMPKPGSHTSFLPRIDSGKQHVEGQTAELARCLRYVDPSRPVTLELSHGADRQVISLPTEKLDKNKRYYVTFTIKGGDAKSAEKERHQHAKSF